MNTEFTKISFLRSYLVPALLLFAVPSIGLYFSEYVRVTWDGQFLQAVREGVSSDPGYTEERAAEIIAFSSANPPSVLCRSESGAANSLPPGYDGCGDYQQIAWMHQGSLASLGLGILSVFIVLLLAAIAYGSRDAQYWSFRAGWLYLQLSSVVQAVLQGVVFVLLSFWLTAFFFERYSPKLIVVSGLLALIAVFLVISLIFKRPGTDFSVAGERLGRDSSPLLWQHIEAICQRLRTQPPDHILAGIDDNFFVTEHPVTLGEETLNGRTLFVSLSLLKRLDKREADAVLAHEVAHFSGGDTESSKKLAPLLTHFEAYMTGLTESAVSMPIFYFMLFYWSLFQLGVGKHSRSREFRADGLAAKLISPSSVAHALLKVAAYSSYRGRVEARLFEKDESHRELNIADRVATGFTEYAGGSSLHEDLSHESFPHPFDSHPPLADRLKALNVMIPDSQIPSLVMAASQSNWFEEIGDAQGIEDRLWDEYEARFREAHEFVLAYRYLPSNDEERELVERFFPEVTFANKSGDVGVRMDYAGLRYEKWDSDLAWDEIKSVQLDDNTFGGQTLTLRLVDGKPTMKIPLGKLQGSKEVVPTFESYYGRAVAAKEYLESQQVAAVATEFEAQ